MLPLAYELGVLLAKRLALEGGGSLPPARVLALRAGQAAWRPQLSLFTPLLDVLVPEVLPGLRGPRRLWTVR